MRDDFGHQAKLRSIARFRGISVWVVGDLMLDEYIDGDVDRLSPEAPVPVVDVRFSSIQPGGAGNVAHCCAVLGAKVRVCGVIGRDLAGDQLLALCQDIGIDMMAVGRATDRPTSRKLRVSSRQHQICRVDWERRHAISAELAAKLLEQLASGPPPAVILVSDYAKGFVTPSAASSLIEWATLRQIPVVVDSKARDLSLYRGASVLTPNLRELAAATGSPSGLADDEIESAGRTLLEQTASTAVIVKLGERGLKLIERQQAHHLPPLTNASLDPSGAGDVVLAVVGLARATGAELLAAADLARAAAEIAIRKRGATVVYPEELAAACITKGDKIFAPAAFYAYVASLKRAGKKIVLTNGCFDLLHRGHLELLREASRLGDVLVVGVNADASVTRLKGPGRPIIPAEDRAAILAALDFVAAVTIFPDDTPLHLIERIIPDVLVKGSDYASDEVVGRTIVEENGGRVVLLNQLPGRSTSATIGRVISGARNPAPTS